MRRGPVLNSPSDEAAPLRRGPLFYPGEKLALPARDQARVARCGVGSGESAVSPPPAGWLPSENGFFVEVVTSASGDVHRLGSWRSLRSNSRARSAGTPPGGGSGNAPAATRS